MGLYIKDDDVKIRLLGKIRFTADPENENAMQVALLRRLISEAEGQVEFDLSPRYATPFVTTADASFSKLPERPTKEILRTLCELKAVIRVLETDFGRGTAVDGDKYKEKLQKRYDSIMGQQLERRKEGLGWKYPPLLELKLNYFNTEADDGYMGMVLSTSQGDGAYPASRINDPGENWSNAVWDDENQDDPLV